MLKGTRVRFPRRRDPNPARSRPIVDGVSGLDGVYLFSPTAV